MTRTETRKSHARMEGDHGVLWLRGGERTEINDSIRELK